MSKVLITPQEVEQFLRELSLEIVAFDTETTSLTYSELCIEGVSLYDGKKGCYIYLQGRDKDGTVTFVNSDQEIILKLLDEYFGKVKMAIAHNIVYDLCVFHKYGIEVKGELFCSMVADHLIDENRRHGLKYLAGVELGYDTVGYDEASSKGSDSKEFFTYAINDAVWTYELAMQQRIKLIEQGLSDLFRKVEMPFQRVLTEMKVTGVLIDTTEVEETSKKIVKEIEDVTVEMLNYLGESYDVQIDLTGKSSILSPINFSSSQQMAAILFDKLGLKVVETTDAGARSVGKSTIEHHKEHEFVSLLSRYKGLSKLLAAFFNPLPGFIESDGRVRPNFRDVGTATGRLSCNKPNLQQLPKAKNGVDTRKCFVVPEGYKMIACDYSGQELRVLAEISQEPIMIDTFNKGKDMHLSTANDFFELEIPEECLYTNHPEFNDYKWKFKNERNKAKTINFGMAYGKGAYGFSKDFGITEDEAQSILDKYFAALPKVKDSIESCHRQVKQTGVVTTMVGRRRRFNMIDGEYYPKKSFRQAFNFLIQGYSADMIRIAANKVYALSKTNSQWGLKAVMTVHDECVYQVKEEYAELAAKCIKREFEEAVKFSVPLVADVSVGMNYGEVK